MPSRTFEADTLTWGAAPRDERERWSRLLDREDELIALLDTSRDLSSRRAKPKSKPNPRNVGIATDPTEQGKEIAEKIARDNEARLNQKSEPEPKAIEKEQPTTDREVNSDDRAKLKSSLN